TSGYSEAPAFARSEGNRLLYVGHLRNFFTLNDDNTLELGLSAISGPNDSARVSNMGVVDLTYKWKPVKLNTYHSLTWQSEFYFNHANLMDNYSMSSFGMYSFLQYQLEKRWFLTGWYATEFSKLEFETKTTDDNIDKRFYQAWLRWIFVIGAHGAHQY